MVGRPSWALGCVAVGVALVAAGCSGPSVQKAASASAAVLADAAARAGHLGGRIDPPATSSAAGTYVADEPDTVGDPSASTEAPLPSTARDERTLSEDHPYRARHGLADCDLDCSAHEAGYKWAALHSLRDPNLCAGKTQGFVHGCRAYVVDHQVQGRG